MGLDIFPWNVDAGVLATTCAHLAAKKPELLRDFRLLEGERDIGGNAAHAESPVTRYPLGAHYLPLPTREATDLVELLA
ncbi:MAG: FAD/NAD(P)-binding protein, partial [Planctomycetota bacterium]